MPQTIADVLTQAVILVDDDTYVMLSLSPLAVIAAAAVLAEIADPFMMLMVDARELTLILEQEAFEEYGHRLLGHIVAVEPYRLITFDLVLEPTLVGFMAVIAQTLADAGIPILPLAAYARDHVLVPANRVDDATNALHQLQQKARNTP